MSEAVSKLLVSIDSSDELKHHGVKGQRWGVLRESAAGGNHKAQKTLAKADSQWEHELNSTKGFIKVNNGMADKMNGPNGSLAKLNNDPRFKGKDLSQPSKAQSQYHQAYEKLHRSTFESVTNELYGESPSGKFTVSYDWDNYKVNVVPAKEVKHDFDGNSLSFSFAINDKGFVTSFGDDTTDSTEHFDLGEFLEHHGVRGQKWGVRRAGRGGSGKPSVHIGGPNLSVKAQNHIINSLKSRKASIDLVSESTGHKTPIKYNPKVTKVSNGTLVSSTKRANDKVQKQIDKAAQKHTAFPEHPDHTNVTVLKNKPVSSLSNKELKDLNTRLQLQKTNKDLTRTKNPAAKGHEYVKAALGVAATATAVYSFAQSPLGKEIRSRVTTAVQAASK